MILLVRNCTPSSLRVAIIKNLCLINDVGFDFQQVAFYGAGRLSHRYQFGARKNIDPAQWISGGEQQDHRV